MTYTEVLEKIKEQYEKAKILAKQAWHEGDHEGNTHDQFYFESGLFAGLSCGLKQNLEDTL